MLTIMTGLTAEADIARSIAAPGTLVLCGKAARDNLDKLVPNECQAILSFGLCGGLAPALQIGQILLATHLISPNGIFEPDVSWLHRLFTQTRAYERTWYSSGLYDEANTVAQRDYMYKRTGSWCIDDESYHVAKLAKQRNIPFAIMRSVSDGAQDTVPDAAMNATNPDGSSNLTNVLKSLAKNPFQLWNLLGIAKKYNLSVATLRGAAIQVGPTFQWK